MSAMPGVPSITVKAAAALLDERDGDAGPVDRAAGAAPDAAPLLVDVRERQEFDSVRVAGAMLVPISEFAARHAAIPRDRPLLVMCHLGSRSASATMFLRAQGWTDVRNIEGGIDAWERAGLPVRRGAPAPGEGELPG